jgi:hypothetical protein
MAQAVQNEVVDPSELPNPPYQVVRVAGLHDTAAPAQGEDVFVLLNDPR